MAEGPHDFTLVKPRRKKGKKVNADQNTPDSSQCKPIAPTAVKLRNERLKSLEKLLEKSNLSNDLDETLDTITKIEKFCAMTSCKTKVQNYSIDCEFCQCRYCVKHQLPEVHGCGQAVAKDAQKKFKAEYKILVTTTKTMPKPTQSMEKNLKKLDHILANMQNARSKKSTLPNTTAKVSAEVTCLAKTKKKTSGKPKIPKEKC